MDIYYRIKYVVPSRSDDRLRVKQTEQETKIKATVLQSQSNIRFQWPIQILILISNSSAHSFPDMYVPPTCMIQKHSRQTQSKISLPVSIISCANLVLIDSFHFVLGNKHLYVPLSAIYSICKKKNPPTVSLYKISVTPEYCFLPLSASTKSRQLL